MEPDRIVGPTGKTHALRRVIGDTQLSGNLLVDRQGDGVVLGGTDDE
jgi:hypothetical protein